MRFIPFVICAGSRPTTKRNRRTWCFNPVTKKQAKFHNQFVLLTMVVRSFIHLSCWVTLGRIVDKTNRLGSSTNFKRCEQSCFVLCWTNRDRANGFGRLLLKKAVFLCRWVNCKWVWPTKVDMVCFAPERFGVELFRALALRGNRPRDCG